jgi:putative polyhydroxyalkanoate system protein
VAGFQIRKAYTMPKEDLRSAAEGLVSKLENAHGVSARWDGDKVRIKGSGVDGQLTLGEDDLLVSVSLGLLASAFKHVLRGEVQRYLDEHVS